MLHVMGEDGAVIIKKKKLSIPSRSQERKNVNNGLNRALKL